MPDQIGPFEVTNLPAGFPVYYRDSDHSYWRDIKTSAKGEVTGTGRLTGVSTVVAPFDMRPDALLNWAARMTCEGVAALAGQELDWDTVEEMRAGLQWLASGESIGTRLEDARLRHSDARDSAATRGTNVHKHALAAMAEGRSVPHLDRMTDEERGYARGVMGFFLDHDVKPLQSEQLVCDPDLGVAGRFDLRCALDGELALIDAKTSGFIPTKHHAQLGGYEHCARACGIGETKRQWILQVTPDGEFDLIPSHGTAESFRAAVTVYRDAARIQREANASRKAVAA